MTKPHPSWEDDQIEEMLRRMGEGETLTSIAADKRMPSMATMIRWEDERGDLGERITRARAQGYTVRAEKAVTNAQGCADPVKGRLAFDAERWFLGKMHPKKFGDATTIKHADANGEKIEMDEVTRAARLAAIAAQINQAQGRDDDASAD